MKPTDEQVDALVKALRSVQQLISEGAMTGFNCKDGDWPTKLFESQQETSRAVAPFKQPVLPAFPRWCCPRCGTPIGYLGRFFLWAFRLTPACAKERNKP